MTNILIPTDFSKNAWHAISYALLLFKDETCTFYLLHTYTPAFYRMDYMLGGPEASALPDTGVDASLAGLERTLADIRKEFPNKRHRFEVLSAFNTLTDEIREQCETKQIDLVVMGTRGAGGAKQLFLGSNTVFAIRKATVPVLAIPETVLFHPPRCVLFPSDYLSAYKPEELAPLLHMIRMHQARVVLLHVNDGSELTDHQKDHKAHLERLMGDADYDVVEIYEGQMPGAVLDYIDEHPIDMLVMMNRKHDFFERILERQNVDRIGFHVRIPFLVMPDSSAVEP